MSKRSGKAPPAGADDFKLIKGIGPVVESRLHNAEILTFEQLAGMTPEMIAPFLGDLNGMSAERIAELDWRGRAQKLASEKIASKSTVPINSHDYARFSVEIMHDENKKVLVTGVKEIHQKDYERRPGWQERFLIDYIVEHAGFQVQPPQPSSPAPAQADLIEGSYELAASPAEESPASLGIKITEVLLQEAPVDQLFGGTAFTKRLQTQVAFELVGTAAERMSVGQSVYSVRIQARELTTDQTTELAQEQAQLQPNLLSYTTMVEFNIPDVGRYQLLGSVLLQDGKTIETCLGPIFNIIA